MIVGAKRLPTIAKIFLLLLLIVKAVIVIPSTYSVSLTDIL